MSTQQSSPQAERSREAFRKKKIEEIPKWYSPTLHILGAPMFATILFFISYSLLQNTQWYEFLVLPIGFIYANAFEWNLHKGFLHKRRALASALYDKHTPIHHRIYRFGSMEIRDKRELKYILLPLFAVFLIIVAAALPIVIGIYLFNTNVGGLIGIMQAIYIMLYELSHLSYHLPLTHWVRSIPLHKKLSRHHEVHHAPELMQNWNFNLFIPLWDWWKGTIAPASEIAKINQRDGDTIFSEG